MMQKSSIVIQNIKTPSKFPEIDLLMRQDMNKEAVLLVWNLLEHEPRNYRGWRILCVALCGLRNFYAALMAIERALTFKPQNIYYQRLRAFCLKETGGHEEAIPLLESLHAANPADLKVIDALATCHYKNGNKTLALKYGAMKLERQFFQAQVSVPAPSLKKSWKPKENQKNVVAFSLWSREAQYCLGAMINARQVKKMLPGWVARFYVDEETIPASVISDLLAQEAEVIEKEEIPMGVPCYSWRFLVADDLSVARFLCRDVDSRISAREVSAVEKWLESSMDFHVMRDHVLHNDLILAGLWGGVSHKTWSMLEMLRAFQESNNDDRRYGVDQAFLEKKIWPLIQRNVLTHDSYYKLGESSSFPGGKKGTDKSYVGLLKKDAAVLKKEGARFGIKWSAFSEDLEIFEPDKALLLELAKSEKSVAAKE